MSKNQCQASIPLDASKLRKRGLGPERRRELSLLLRPYAIQLMIVVLAFCAPACSPAPSTNPPDGFTMGAVLFSTDSPFCSGKTLDSCTHPHAEQWRRDIGQWLAQGVPETEIRSRLRDKAALVDLRSTGARPGWLIIVVAILLSSLWLIVVSRTLNGPLPPHRIRPPQSDSTSGNQLEEKLASLDP